MEEYTLQLLESMCGIRVYWDNLLVFFTLDVFESGWSADLSSFLTRSSIYIHSLKGDA